MGQTQPRLTERSKAVRLLRQKFESGEVSGKEDPKDLWLSSDVVKKHGIDRFRTKYNKLRKEYGVLVPQKNAELEDLNTKCVLDGTHESKKRRMSELIEEADEGPDEITAVRNSDDDLVEECLTFKPLTLLSKWEQQGSRAKRITAAIALPSGIGPGEFSLQVVGGGSALELTVKWPTPLMDMEVMHRMWLQDFAKEQLLMYHPKILGFEKALQELRGNASEAIESTARIVLPFEVESHIDAKKNLALRTVELSYFT